MMNFSTIQRLYRDPFVQAEKLLSLHKAAPKGLRPDAEKWVASLATLPERPRVHNANAEVLWCMLAALPPVGEVDPFRELLQASRTVLHPLSPSTPVIYASAGVELIRSDFAGGVHYSSTILDVLVELAPLRAQLAQWPEAIGRWSKACGSVVARLFADEIRDTFPALAYDALDVHAPPPPEVAPGACFSSAAIEAAALRGEVTEGFEAALQASRAWRHESLEIALCRYATLTDDKLLERELRLVNGLPVGDFFSNDDLHWSWVRWIADRGGRLSPAVLDFARRLAAECYVPTLRVRAWRLLARKPDEGDQVVQQMAGWIAGTQNLEGLIFALRHNADGMFCGQGWGREKIRKRLLPIANAVLSRGLWHLLIWEALLMMFAFQPVGREHRPAGPRDQEELAAWVRDLLCELLFQLARTPENDLELRLRAVEALGLSGAGTFAKDLKKLAEQPELAGAARAAQNALRKSSRTAPVPADIGMDLALERFCGVAS